MKPFDRIVMLLGFLAILAAGGALALRSPSASARPPATFVDELLKPTPRPSRITFVPEPASIEVFWVDSAGNLGMRGVDAVVPGTPAPDMKISEACRKSATSNGDGTLTICMSPAVGKTLGKKLGFDEWTSGTSTKP